MKVLAWYIDPKAMNRENRLLVTDELVEVQDVRKFTDHYRGIYGICLQLMMKTRRMSTYSGLELETLGS